MRWHSITDDLTRSKVTKGAKSSSNYSGAIAEILYFYKRRKENPPQVRNDGRHLLEPGFKGK